MNEVPIARSFTRMGWKDMVGEAEGVDMVGERVAGRGPRDRGDSREEVEFNPKCRSRVLREPESPLLPTLKRQEMCMNEKCLFASSPDR